jgi:hypothetical protein
VFLLAVTAIAAFSPAWGGQPPAVEVPTGAGAGQPVDLLNPLDPPVTTDEFPQRLPTPGFGGFRVGEAGDADKILVFASFTEKQEDQPARLFVSAKMGPKWHVYSLTQPAGAVKATAVELDASDQYQLLGGFVPDQRPEVREVEVFDVPLEEHYGTVTFSAPVEITAGVDPAGLRIKGQLSGMICHDELGCIQLSDVDTSFSAQLATGQEARDLLDLVLGPDVESDDRDAAPKHARNGYWPRGLPSGRDACRVERPRESAACPTGRCGETRADGRN